MQTDDIMERDSQTKRDRYSAMAVAPTIPASLPAARQLDEAFSRLVGTNIVSIGTPYSDEIEGGGLIIDYIRPANDPAFPADPNVHRVVFGFNELGLWIEWDSRA